MAKKEKPAVAGVIDIGSNALRLKIAQNAKNKVKVLDSLTYPLSLGRDTFDTGRISFEKVEKTCEIILHFLTEAAAYGVGPIKAVATTAVREATNLDYILDQIKIKTGLSVEVIDDMQEKLYIYKLMCHVLTDEMKRSAMMVYIGSGNVGLSVLDEGKMPFSQNVKMGSLRISELFGEIQEYTSEFYRVLEEYLKSFTDTYAEDLAGNIRNFVASGNEIAMIAELAQAKTNGQFSYITKEKFEALYDDVKYKTCERIATDYGISQEKADILLPAMCIFKNLFSFTSAEVMISPQVFLSDSILYETLCPDEFAAIHKDFAKNTLLSARTLAKKFDAEEAHYRFVENFAVKIFDKMKKIHGLGAREKLYLQTASILHDMGKRVNVRGHSRHSYNIVRGLDIVGLNMQETELVALICLYHSQQIPSHADANYRALNPAQRVLVSKLSAILRIADALDRSHTQKFSDLDVRINDGELQLTLTSQKSADLEQWAFNVKGQFFEDVFGLKASARIRIQQKRVE